MALLSRFSRKSVQLETVPASSDPLAAFASETALASAAIPDRPARLPYAGAAVRWTLVVLASAAVGAVATWAYPREPAMPQPTAPDTASHAAAQAPPPSAVPAPLPQDAAAAHEHVVVLRLQDGSTLRRTVAVKPGEDASIDISGSDAAAPTRAGWVAFAAPIVLELRENGRVIGTTAAERLMLPAGDHQIELINESLGYRATRRVAVAPDRTVAIPVDVPSGTVSINALPWAEVWIGGERIGETPIANLARPIGAHDVILRHPQFGERRASLTVSLKQPARLGVDMRTP